MAPKDQLKVPEDISSEEELNEWINLRLEKFGENISSNQEVKLFRAITRFCRNKENQRFFQAETVKYYERKLVYALMEHGWELKRDPRYVNSKALRNFKEALRITPENPLACYRIGHLKLKEDKKGEAIGFFSMALDLSKDDIDIPQQIKLNSLQIKNARGLSLALLSELSNFFYDPFEFLFSPNQIEKLQQFLRSTVESQVVYTYAVKDNKPSEIKSISLDEYDNLIKKTQKEPNALVIDRFNDPPVVRYLHNDSRNLVSTNSQWKYLLFTLGFEPNYEFSTIPNTCTQTIGRLNQTLNRLGVGRSLNIDYSRNTGFSVVSDVTVHYFRKITH